MDKLVEKIARVLFDEEYAVPKEWDWATIKEHAPMSSIKCEQLALKIIPIISHVRDCEWMGRLIDAGIPIMDDPKDMPENLYTQAYLDNRLRVQAEEIKKELEGLIIGMDNCEFEERMDGDKGCIVLDMNMNQWNDYWRKRGVG